MLKGSEYSPLTLAYIGDAVFEILARIKTIEDINSPVKSLHKQTACYVNAQAQAEMYHKISEYLTEDELSVLKPKFCLELAHTKSPNATQNNLVC